MSPPHPLAALPPGLAGRLNPVCDRFETQWRDGAAPRLEEFLPLVDEADRPALLHELLQLELHYRARRGEVAGTEEYRRRLPDHAAVVAAVFSVAAAADCQPGQPLRESVPQDGPDGTPTTTPRPPQQDAGNAHTVSSHTVEETGENPPAAPPQASLLAFLAPAQAADELGRLGPHRILTILGRGGMGVVFQAEDPRLKRSVALKAMLPAVAASGNAGQRFLREAQAMAAVEHEHIVRIDQVDEERGAPFLAMEILKGESLDKRLKRPQRVPLVEVLRIGREIALGLAAAHEQGLIHRDVKPANIWLAAPGDRVKLLDFGLARPTADDAHLTQEGAVVGTPAYMAPEQARSEAVDARSDLFSLGVVLYRLCTGQPPFKGKDAMSTLMSVALDQPPPPRQVNADLPRELSDLVMALLEKESARRPPSAAAVVQALRALENDLAGPNVSPENAVAAPSAAQRGGAARRGRLPVLLAAVVLLVGLIGVGAFALIRIQGEQGDYVIETDDADFSFRVSKGAVTLHDDKTKRKYVLKVLSQKKAAGEQEVEVTDEDAALSFKTKTFTIRRGEKVALKAWFQRKQGVAAKGASVDDAWFKEVANMPAEQQVEAVAARLKERNPRFDGLVTHKIERGVVTELKFVADNVTDLSPVRALTELRTLECFGSSPGRGRLADLSPLKDMKLTTLNCMNTKVADLSVVKDMKLTYLKCARTQVSDLSPLKDMKLTILACDHTQVSDLSPLKDMTLGYLNCDNTQVSDLSPLMGMPLTNLGCNGTKVSDLSPLKDMKLTTLDCGNTQVSDLSLLKDMKLTKLLCGSTQVTDLSPLKDMKLTYLDCNGTQVSDLSPLRGMPLKDLRCDFKPERDAEILRSIKTLETINEKPAKELWRDVDAKKLKTKP